MYEWCLQGSEPGQPRGGTPWRAQQPPAAWACTGCLRQHALIAGLFASPAQNCESHFSSGAALAKYAAHSLRGIISRVACRGERGRKVDMGATSLAEPAKLGWAARKLPRVLLPGPLQACKP